MAAGNMILAFPNRADEAALSGGGWEPDLPLANLQQRLLSKKARSLDASLLNAQFDIALTKPRPMRVIVLVNHNLGVNALFRVQGATDAAFAGVVYDSGWLDVWPAVFPSETREWEDEEWWSGRLTPEERAGYTSALIHVLATPVLAQYWRLELDDTANADGYVEAGRLFLSGQWQPADNHSWGAALGYEDLTEIETALGGQEYFDARAKFRTYRFVLNYLNHDDGHARALEAQRQLGISGETFIIPDPSDTTHMIRRAFLARMRQLSALEYPYLDNTTMAFELKEII